MDAPAPQGCPPGCLPVPLKALQQPNDMEQMQQPEEGDSVSLQVDAIVRGIEGEMAYIEPSAINGTPLDDEGNEPNPDDEQAAGDMQEGQDLRGQAGAMQ